jgi:hypothetical protein
MVLVEIIKSMVVVVVEEVKEVVEFWGRTRMGKLYGSCLGLAPSYG